MSEHEHINAPWSEEDMIRLLDEVRCGGNQWKITDDGTADWAVEKIANTRAFYDRMIATCKSRIANLHILIDKYMRNSEEETEFLRVRLAEYFSTVPHRTTKTSERYDLPSGRLVLKHAQPEARRQEDVLAEWARQWMPEAVKVKVSPDWAKIKEAATIVDGRYVIATSDGEVVPVEGVTLVEREATFEVEVGK